MDKTFNEIILDKFNELEAKYKEACVKVSQYEEENRILREQRKKLTDARNELAEDNENLKDESFKYHYRLDKLGKALKERGIYCRWFEAEMGWHLYEGKTMDDLKQHYEEELRIREKEKDEKDKLINELNSKIMALKLRTNMMYGYGFDNAQINAQIRLIRKNEALEKENEELNQKVKDLESKDSKNIAYGYFNLIASLREKIEAIEKENKELKNTLNKDMEFGRNVGEHIAESIREGCDKGVYELHPYTRIDIHVEETNNMPTIFDRHAIPRIAVMFNNTQTEMERDTAQHECEELEKKIKELERKNEDLK